MADETTSASDGHEKTALIEELLLPEVSTDGFTVQGRLFNIRMMPYTHEKKIIRMLRPAIAEFTDNPRAGFGEILVDAGTELLPDIVTIICQMTDPTITKDWVEANMTLGVMKQVLEMQITKNGYMDKVQDFFRRAVAQGRV